MRLHLLPGPTWKILTTDVDCAWCCEQIDSGQTALFVHGIATRLSGEGEAALAADDYGVHRWFCPLCVIELWPGRFGAEQYARPDWRTVQVDEKRSLYDSES